MLPPDFQLAPITAADYPEVLALWNACEGIPPTKPPKNSNASSAGTAA